MDDMTEWWNASSAKVLIVFESDKKKQCIYMDIMY